MALGTTRYFARPDARRPFFRYGIALRVVPGNHTVPIEIERAPDSGGSPGTYVHVATLTNVPKSGANYVDMRPAGTATWWYRARHGKGSLYGNDGAYITAVSGVARLLTDDDFVEQTGSSTPFTRTEDILASAVTTATINDDAVTNAKVADDAIQTAQLAAAAVTPAEAQGRSRCKLSKTANQSISNSSTTALTFDAESFDVGSLHDNSTNNTRITIPTGGDTGVWLFHAHVVWASGATSYMVAKIKKNGTTDVASSTVTAVGSTTTSQDVIYLANAPSAGDYFEVTVLQVTGGNLDVEMDSTDYLYTKFEAQHLW